MAQRYKSRGPVTISMLCSRTQPTAGAAFYEDGHDQAGSKSSSKPLLLLTVQIIEERDCDRELVPRPAYRRFGAIGPLSSLECSHYSKCRRVGGRAGTAVPKGAVCEPPNPPVFPSYPSFSRQRVLPAPSESMGSFLASLSTEAAVCWSKRGVYGL